MKFILVLLAILQLTQFGYSSQIDFNYYHTTDEVFDVLQKLENSCSQQFSVSQIHKNPDLRVVKMNEDKKKPYKAFLLFGEHPREMISTETAVKFLKTLCDNKTNLAKEINENYSIQLVANANPISRAKVEQGDYCLRENENGVDINRNYDAHWERVEDQLRQDSSGPEPFSEIQTKTIKDLLDKQQPHYFVTVHSGTLGLFTPYAYSEEIPEKNGQTMYDIMEQVNDRYCVECTVGAAGKEVGYLCPGTCLDYAYENENIPYAYAMEIYEKDVDLREYVHQDIDTHDSLFLENKERRYLRNSNAFVQMQETNIFGSDYDKCFCYFNPTNEKEYNFVVENWSEALLDSLNLTRIELDS